MSVGSSYPSRTCGRQRVSVDNRRAPSLDELKALIAKRELTLPEKSEAVARVIFAEPDYVAFENAAAIARRCHVSPATVSRLASRLGFGSFVEMQSCFRNHILHRFKLQEEYVKANC
ncbi:MurR/RpiR family transcriptional regulator [Mesorhizobium sp. M0136]|uniref:MurR/RpiR family transcriptional regulator n=1 Tax=Mesorhizobium sp. M0136 TaxID=2956890 RepID=UPI00333DC6C1